ncbi:MAG: hypothetical protein H7256_09470 [Bdellovibrio sp.]|nr:hypothetical protein [Bdellovibrio sp.]
MDKSNRIVIVTFLPNVLKGLVKGFYLFIQDITDLKKAEMTAIKERQVAMQAATNKSQFLANMSHEIRTPINGIIGMTNLLKATLLDEQQIHFADLVSRSSESLLNIINDVLDFSKIEAGKLELEIINFDLYEMVTDVIQSISFSAETRNVALNLQFEVDTKAYYKWDPGRFRQIYIHRICFCSCIFIL